jgi:SAM-dependent methyltransferase
VTRVPAVDLLGAAMVDFAAGRRSPVWLRIRSGRRLTHDLAAYFALVTPQERALLDLVEEPVLDVGCGPARHARLLQARGLTAIGLDRSLLALGLARALGLRQWLHADACSGPLPPARTGRRPCCSTATSAWPGRPPAPPGSCIAWPRPVGRAGDCW